MKLMLPALSRNLSRTASPPHIFLLRFKATSLGRGGGYRLCIEKCRHSRSL